MEGFRAELRACDPVRGISRAYRIEAGRDLLGDWVVDVTYGRIGSRGRLVRHVVTDEHEARKIVRRCLRRRATAPERIGVAYEIREVVGEPRWLERSTPSESLATATASPTAPGPPIASSPR